MPRQAIDWVLTDTHWFHDAICTPEFENRPLDHMDITLRACRHLVAPQDRVIHMGDVIFYNHSVLKSLLDSFPCQKTLVMGNHDKKSRGWYMRNGFHFACDAIVLDDVLFTHIPVRPLARGTSRLNVHGHWHGAREIPDWWTPTRYRLLSLELQGYHPQKLIDVLREDWHHDPKAGRLQ